MDIKIVIQSHKRWDNVLTKDVFIDPIICVEESQKKMYETHNPDCEIVTHPDSVIGLPAKKNWMYKKFGNVWMADDDITGIRDYNREPDGTTGVMDKTQSTNLINEIFLMAENLGVYLFGLGNKNVPMSSPFYRPMRLSGAVTGGSYGIREGSDLYWNTSIKTGEDHWISMLNAYKHRRCLILDTYYAQQQGTFTSRGGLAEFRDKKTEKETFIELRKCFGDVVSKKKMSLRSTKKNEYSRTMTLPF